MQRLIIISGSPGSGKTSCASALSAMIDPCVLIETDVFYNFIHNPVDPSTAAAQAQNEMVIAAYTEAAKAYYKGGFTVILEGVIGPWLLSAIEPRLHRFHYFLLHTSLVTALERVAGRKSKALSPGVVERMHPQFERSLSDYSAHVIETDTVSPAAVADIMLKKIEQGHCEIGSHSGQTGRYKIE